MKTQIRQILPAALLLIASTLRAQVVADGATNTLSNVTNTFTGDVTVGTNGLFTLLVLSDNGTIKFIIVNPPVGNRFYRLFKP